MLVCILSQQMPICIDASSNTHVFLLTPPRSGRSLLFSRQGTVSTDAGTAQQQSHSQSLAADRAQSSGVAVGRGTAEDLVTLGAGRGGSAAVAPPPDVQLPVPAAVLPDALQQPPQPPTPLPMQQQQQQPLELVERMGPTQQVVAAAQPPVLNSSAAGASGQLGTPGPPLGPASLPREIPAPAHSAPLLRMDGSPSGRPASLSQPPSPMGGHGSAPFSGASPGRQSFGAAMSAGGYSPVGSPGAGATFNRSGSGPAMAPRKPRAQRQVDALQAESRERRKSERRLSKGAQIAWSTCQIIEGRELKLLSAIGSGAYGKVRVAQMFGLHWA